LVPSVAKALQVHNPQLQFEFVITLPEGHPILRRVWAMAAELGVVGRIRNVGSVAVADAPRLYEECDLCFLPTVLETFSATYPESMAMGLPIVTTDLPFARDVCGNAALYFEPNNAKAAAICLSQLVEDSCLWEALVSSGKSVLAQLPTPQEKYSGYVCVMSNLVQKRPLDRGLTDLVRSDFYRQAQTLAARNA
jgi:glycosyltransferase involved in cell wall biosynthesis